MIPQENKRYEIAAVGRHYGTARCTGKQASGQWPGEPIIIVYEFDEFDPLIQYWGGVIESGYLLEGDIVGESVK